MSEKQGFYSIIQYSPVPDRFEFANIGVVLVAPDRKFFGIRFSKGARRIEKMFGKQKQGAYLAYLKQSIAERLKVEFSRDLSHFGFEKFVDSRANDVRFSRPLPMLIEEPKADLDELFESLVGEEETMQRGPKVVTKFRKQLEAAGVSHLLQKPEPVSLPKYGITIEAPYAYQNGAYNLIDPVRLSGDADDAIKEASKRAVEGQWLKNQTDGQKKLIVVGDFEGQSVPGIEAAVSDMMEQHQVGFYSFRHIAPLVFDIKHHGHVVPADDLPHWQAGLHNLTGSTGVAGQMPRRARGPRLYLDPKRKQWVIRDGKRFIRTGRAATDVSGAEKALEGYIGKKHRPQPSPTPLIDEVLNAYLQEHEVKDKRTQIHTVANLAKWWSGKRVVDITARACRAYSSERPTAAARRDLETLRAAVHYWHREYGPLSVVPVLVLPTKPQSRERWLTRSEAAQLLWAARRTQHLARFILIGLYTGTRSGAILNLKWDWIDLERGIMRRRGVGEAETSKRRPPVRLGARILSHLRRWAKTGTAVGGGWVIHYNGQRVTKLRRSWATAVGRADLDRSVTPHTLRHTRATWLMQAKVNPWQAAGALGMSMRTLEKTYGHHHPDWQREASEV